ncbi:MAG: hypothetical protein JWR26_4990 [Pedosphaera sp.]|nr:hypothetical protein [Pedosphaera sp.]
MKIKEPAWSSFRSPQVSEICAHLTPAEHAELVADARRRGTEIGLWVAGPFGVTAGLFVWSWQVGLGLLVIFIIYFALHVYPRLRAMRQRSMALLYETEWARSQGYTPDRLGLSANAGFGSSIPRVAASKFIDLADAILQGGKHFIKNYNHQVKVLRSHRTQGRWYEDPMFKPKFILKLCVALLCSIIVPGVPFFAFFVVLGLLCGLFHKSLTDTQFLLFALLDVAFVAVLLWWSGRKWNIWGFPGYLVDKLWRDKKTDAPIDKMKK